MIHNITQFDNYDFNGGSLSSDGGSILLIRFIQKNHLLDSFDSLPFFDIRKTFIHSNESILSQLIIRNLLGYFSQDEQEVLLHDPLLFNHSPVASQPSVSRFFDRVTRLTNVQFKHLLQKLTCTYINRYVASPILDADSTMVATDGKQETGYHPLVIINVNLKMYNFDHIRMYIFLIFLFLIIVLKSV